MSYSNYATLEQVLDRIEHLQKAVLLLAGHCGGVGQNYELQRALDRVRDDARQAEPAR